MTDTQTDLVEQLADAVAARVTQKIAGFVPKGRYRRVECDWIEPDEGADPFWVEIRSDLTFDELSSIPLGGDASYRETWDAVWRYVRAWNAVAFNVGAQEYRPVPPPAETGPDVFRAVDPVIAGWIAFVLRRQPWGDETRKKGSTPSSGGPEPMSGSS